MVQDREGAQEKEESMKLTIEIGKIFEFENQTIRNDIKVERFKAAIGEAVYRSAVKLLEFRDENESVAIEGAIASEIADVIAEREA